MATALASPFDDPSGAPAWIGSYRVLDQIAEGGMGRVFRALDTANTRMVAIKTPRTGTAAEIACLRREATILRHLAHPGIVRLIEDGTCDGMPWIAMEFLAGCTLVDEINTIWEGLPRGSARMVTKRRRSDELPTVPVRLLRSAMPDPAAPPEKRPLAAAGLLPRVASTVAQLGMILDHVHGRGLVHRDIKPANVLLRPGGRVTLLDFGLVCRANDAGPAGGVKNLCVGTMHYAAPEQILGQPTDVRTDVYALGCLLYELVTGVPPFDGESASEVAQKQLHREVVAPSQLVSGLPRQLEELLMEMLAKRPNDRPASAGSAAHRLTTAAAGGATDHAPSNPRWLLGRPATIKSGQSW
jgi:eukaryotic-like serine/threonine-protein kinase